MTNRIFWPAVSLALASMAVPPLSAAPVITGVMNAASNIDPRMPNASIAPGSIFIVKGTGLGPATISIASAPFQSTTLSGTSVKLTVGGTSVDALMYYTSATQVAALLPSNTPTGGPGTITVTYNGQPSAATNFRGVTANNLAIFTVDSTGTGPAIVTYPDYSLVSPVKAANCGGPYTTCGAANPGDTLVLWGTGLGAISGSDAAGAGLAQNMPNIPLKVWLGGVQAQVVYQGRSGCCIGEDQVVFMVPDNAPTGCAVPLSIQINNQVSNSTLLAVASGSRTCTPDDAGLAAVDIQQLSTLGSYTVGAPELDHVLNNNGSGYFDQGQMAFIGISNVPAALQPFQATYFDQSPLGTCTVIGSRAPSDMFFNSLTLTPLDAGPSFTVSGPNGSKTITASTGDKPQLSATGTFLTPGTYTLTGAGGKDVGAFTANFTIPIAPTLTSPAGGNGLTVTRANGMTVTWNPNGSTGHVQMVLSSAVDPNTMAQAGCLAPASAGTFTIPPYVLLALPTGNAVNFSFGPGSQGPASSTPFTAPGLTAGLAQTFVDGVFLGGFTLK